MQRIRISLFTSTLLLTILIGGVVQANKGGDYHVHLPFIQEAEPVAEFRGLWVTRFDWTNYGQPADPARIDEIVQNAGSAGFNVILFQVRGTADAYYQPGPEPWAMRVSGQNLGQAPDPLWDPLAYFVQTAHQHGLQLHAYLNVYPVWDNCDNAPPLVTPEHLYYGLEQAHGTTGSNLNGLQWNIGGTIACGLYQLATPASIFADDHYVTVAQYLVDNYDIDGLHLDHIRYSGSDSSCDPVSLCRYHHGTNNCDPVPACSLTEAYKDWQREQVNSTVERFYDEIIQQNSGLWLSAAVWPIYRDYWGWGLNTGYDDYYQDSQRWIADGYIDSISPMIYGSSFWNQSVWHTLVEEFQSNSAGRYIVPGIGGDFDSFTEIEARIEMGRAIGTAGHAIFSYSALNNHNYFDDLVAGPYIEPAVVPEITWHP
jgi:uncharacterized lipoprotein YddW (UPF0748 family)